MPRANTLLVLVVALCGCVTRRAVTAADGAALVETHVRRTKAPSLYGLESAEGRVLLPPVHEQLVALSPRFAVVGTFTTCTLLELPAQRVVKHWPSCHLIPLAGRGALVHHPNARRTFTLGRSNKVMPGFVAMLGQHGLEWEVDDALPLPHLLFDDVGHAETPARHRIPKKARHWPAQPLVLLRRGTTVELRGRSPTPIVRFENATLMEWFAFAGWTAALVKDARGFHLHDGERFLAQDMPGRATVVALDTHAEFGAIIGPNGLEVLNPAAPLEPRVVIDTVRGARRKWAYETRPWVQRGSSPSDVVEWTLESLLVRAETDEGVRWGLVSRHGTWLVPPTWSQAGGVEVNDGQLWRGLIVAQTAEGWHALETDGRPAVEGLFPTPEAARDAVVYAERARRARLDAERKEAAARLVAQQREQLALVRRDYDAAAARGDWSRAEAVAHQATMRLSYGEAYLDALCLRVRARFKVVGEDFGRLTKVGPVAADLDRDAATACHRERPSAEHGELRHFFTLVARLNGAGTGGDAASVAQLDPKGRFKALSSKVEVRLREDWEAERKRHEEWRNTAGRPQGAFITDAPRTITRPGGGYTDTSFAQTTARVATQMREWSRAFSYATSAHAWNWRQ